MSVHIKISEFDANDLKDAYDLVMRKEKTDAKRGILFVQKVEEEDGSLGLVVRDQVDYHYYVVNRGNGLEVFDYDKNTKKVLDVSYISKEHKHSRNLISDAIKDFYNMYFDAIK